jgi:hypothetical protein
MTTPIRYNCFYGDLGKKIHDLGNDTLKICLTNTAPDVVNHKVFADLTEIAAGGGYTAGGWSIGAHTWAESGAGVWDLVQSADAPITATTGFGPYRYVHLYNFSAAAKNLLWYWDLGSSISTPAGQTFTELHGSRMLRLGS